MKALITGGGIAGTGTAIALRKAGIESAADRVRLAGYALLLHGQDNQKWFWRWRRAVG